MPKKKAASSPSSSDSDSGPDDRLPAKKSKPSNAGSSSQKAGDGSQFWELDKNRRIAVREFKGKTFVDIREFYMKDGDLLPGKKGITLQPAQWRKLLELKDEITSALEAN